MGGAANRPRTQNRLGARPGSGIGGESSVSHQEAPPAALTATPAVSSDRRRRRRQHHRHQRRHSEVHTFICVALAAGVCDALQADTNTAQSQEKNRMTSSKIE